MDRVQTLPARGLSSDLRSAWIDLQAHSPQFDSAFYSPDFTELVGAVRDDVEVGVMYEGDRVVGFFPFLRSPGRTARAVAGRLTELQGPVCRRDSSWDPSDLVRMCGLRAWYFDHLPHSLAVETCTWGTIASPYVDLTQGYARYESMLHHRGRTIEQIHRKERKLAREVGPLRFEMHTGDAAAFTTLLAWKTEQYQRMGHLPIFKYRWVVELLERISRHSTPQLQGVLSTLHAGDHLAAIHLGLRSSQVLHVWFPSYNRALSHHSPGLILMLHLAEQAAAGGIERIDLGTGDERYKQQLKTGDTPLLVGGVDVRFGRAELRRSWHRLNQWIRRSQYREYLEIPLNSTRRYRQWLGFR